jgi:hypothetical protein
MFPNCPLCGAMMLPTLGGGLVCPKPGCDGKWSAGPRHGIPKPSPPGPPPAHVFPCSSDGKGGGPMPPAGDYPPVDLRERLSLAARVCVFPVCLSTAPQPGPSAIERSATPGGWPASVTLRAPDGTTRPLRHVGGGVYEQGED